MNKWEGNYLIWNRRGEEEKNLSYLSLLLTLLKDYIDTFPLRKKQDALSMSMCDCDNYSFFFIISTFLF